MTSNHFTVVCSVRKGQCVSDVSNIVCILGKERLGPVRGGPHFIVYRALTQFTDKMTGMHQASTSIKVKEKQQI